MTIKYRKANVKSRTIDFQKKDLDLYEYSKTFNFTAWIMTKLREELEQYDGNT